MTFETRHKLIDQYLAVNPWTTFAAETVLLEMGCGFPPQTAMDAAHNFPTWQVIGADPQFYSYVLYDADGNYACLDETGSYLQAPFALFAAGWEVKETLDDVMTHYRNLRDALDKDNYDHSTPIRSKMTVLSADRTLSHGRIVGISDKCFGCRFPQPLHHRAACSRTLEGPGKTFGHAFSRNAADVRLDRSPVAALMARR